MKSTAVDESLSSMNQQFCSRENQLLQMLQQNEKSTQIYTSKYYQYVFLHVDPHLSPPIAQWGVSMCIRPICIHIDHLEVFSRDRTGIVNVPEGLLCNFNEGPSPAMNGHILDSH